jgi:hypothetical protein
MSPSTVPANNEVRPMALPRPAASMQPLGGSQYPASENNSLQARRRAESNRTQPLAIGATPTVSAPNATGQGKPNSHTQATPRGFQLAVLGTPPAAPTVPGGALTLVNRPVPVTIAAPGSSSASPATMPQQRNILYAQPHSSSKNNSTMPSTVQRQLEAAPSQNQQFEISRAQPVNLQNQKTAQMAAQPLQIGDVPSQGQLGAPPANYSSTGQELVHQSKDVARKGPGG